MLSGRRLDLLNPSAMDIDIGDIAHGLSRVARWNGQTVGDHAFSVAQHLVLVEQIARVIEPAAGPVWWMAALLSDAPQYVAGDLISPFKSALGIDYRGFEEKLTQAIHLRFDLPAVMPPHMRKFIKRADKAAAYLESIQVAGFDETESRDIFGLPPVTVMSWKVTPLPPNTARAAYIERFEILQTEMQESGVF